MITKLIYVFSILAISCYLFYKASGTLNPGKLSIVTYIFYLFIVQSYIGASLVYLGFRKHYLIVKIINASTIDKTFFIIGFTAIVLPLVMLITAKLFRVNVREKYSNYLKRPVDVSGEENVFIVVLAASIICILATCYMFIKLGSVPLLDLLLKAHPSDIATRRIAISRGTFMNPYIKNIIVLAVTPTLSYLAFVYYVCTKRKSWLLLFGLLFGFSILIKTYDYSKTPVVFYVFVYVLIYIVLKNGIKLRYLSLVILGCVGIILLMYYKNGYDLSKALDIYNGPLGRTMFTQVATLFLHVDLFPYELPFLAGRSFAPTILKLFFGGVEQFRSGRVVMRFYSPEKVFEGTAGVMNTVFTGEAYANFGMKGVIWGVILVAILIQVVFLFFITRKKNPVNITIYAIIAASFALVSQAGFTDFVYNPILILNILMLLAISIVSKYVGKISYFDNVKKTLYK